MNYFDITISRFYTPMGTFGTLECDGLELRTVERNWTPAQDSQAGLRGVSCVPEGVYQGVWHQSRRFGPCWALENVRIGVRLLPSAGAYRTHILVHPGNTVDDLRGCIAPGMAFGTLNHQWGVLSSRLALGKLHAVTDQLRKENRHVRFIIRHQEPPEGAAFFRMNFGWEWQ